MSTPERLLPFLIVVSLAVAAVADGHESSQTPRHGPIPIEAVDFALLGDPATATSLQQTFEMSWWSVDGGGGESAGGDFALTAAIGQPESGIASACGQVLDAGLWSNVIDLQAMYCDNFESGDTSAWSATVP